MRSVIRTARRATCIPLTCELGWHRFIQSLYMYFVLINTHIKLLAAICFKLAVSANLISNARWNTTAFLPLFLLVATGNLISIKRYNVLYVNKLNVFLCVLQNSLLKARKFGPYKIQKWGWHGATSFFVIFWSRMIYFIPVSYIWQCFPATIFLHVLSCKTNNASFVGTPKYAVWHSRFYVGWTCDIVCALRLCNFLRFVGWCPNRLLLLSKWKIRI